MDTVDAQREPAQILGETPPSETMTVRIRDRSAEAPWGSGPISPVIRTVTISGWCPRCGARRGTPRNLNQHDDGCWYSTDIWANPCGHIDDYATVAREAAALGLAGAR